jgi:hypothetical protein
MNPGMDMVAAHTLATSTAPLANLQNPASAAVALALRVIIHCGQLSSFQNQNTGNPQAAELPER